MNDFDVVTVPLAGLNLIEASAGTGKTYAIANLVVRLVAEQGLAINQILIVTFTEAATAELRSRVRARLQAAYALLAVRNYGAATDPQFSLNPAGYRLARL